MAPQQAVAWRRGGCRFAWAVRGGWVEPATARSKVAGQDGAAWERLASRAGSRSRRRTRDGRGPCGPRGDLPSIPALNPSTGPWSCIKPGGILVLRVNGHAAAVNAFFWEESGARRGEAGAGCQMPDAGYQMSCAGSRRAGAFGRAALRRGRVGGAGATAPYRIRSQKRGVRRGIPVARCQMPDARYRMPEPAGEADLEPARGSSARCGAERVECAGWPALWRGCRMPDAGYQMSCAGSRLAGAFGGAALRRGRVSGAGAAAPYRIRSQKRGVGREKAAAGCLMPNARYRMPDTGYRMPAGKADLEPARGSSARCGA
jgi:hypothetical protein